MHRNATGVVNPDGDWTAPDPNYDSDDLDDPDILTIHENERSPNDNEEEALALEEEEKKKKLRQRQRQRQR